VLQSVEKLEAHQRGLQHKAVSVFVLNGSHTLLQRSILKKYHTPGLWTNSCCTHPNWKMLGLNCAQRRPQEELGIIGVEPQYIDTIEYRSEVPPGLIETEVVQIFFANFTSVTMRPNPDEVMTYCWESL
jgi:isopentenyl-diphosphate delta-isomerase